MLQDVRLAIRFLWRKPAFSATAIVALALAIGGSAAIFSVCHAVLLESLPYPDADRLVVVGEATWKDRTDLGAVSPANYLDWANDSRAFAGIAVYRQWVWNFTGADRPERVIGAVVSGGFFPVLGVAPALGRALGPQDAQPGHDDVAVLGYRLWRDAFAADPHVLGRTVTLNARPYTVVGVMPARFSMPEEAGLWVPSPWDVPPHPLTPTEDPRALRDSHYLDVIARRRSDVTPAQMQADLDRVARQVIASHADADRDTAVGALPLRESLVGSNRPMLLLLAAAIVLVLFIACANVAGLLLVRTAERAPEISLRAALGASRFQLLRLAGIESLVLSLAGGAAGLVTAVWATPALVALCPPDLAPHVQAALGWRLVLFGAGASLVAALLSAIVPALHLSRASIGASLQHAGRGAIAGSGRLRAALVSTEMALSVVLAIMTGLLVLSFTRVLRVNPGFSPDGVLASTVAPSVQDQRTDGRFYRNVIEQVRQVPGVESVAAVSRLPLAGGNSSRSIRLPGSDVDYSADFRVATPGYFHALGIPLHSGRSFEWTDDETAPPVAVINETLARRLFPHQDPIGRTIAWDKGVRVVGIVGDIRHVAVEVPPRPELYVPFAQSWWPSMTMVVRSAVADPEALAGGVQRAVWSVDKGVPLGNVRTMRAVVGRALAGREFLVLLLSLFAGVAVVLTAIGLYGAVAYSVSRRTREIGIRVALGARRATIVRALLAQALVVTGAGAAAGLAVALAVARLMTGLLFGVTARDPLVFTVVPLVLVGVALVASYVPAGRAARIDPMAALRDE